ncbi:MAG: sigma-70 family RNA polymerase sigma factor [Maribacter dokdonensis]|uniref:RNA polymerase sigma-70 factor, ECF subfamily n=3 Tax=Maribacter dokdonensis TaxID=320912 RepID=A0A1H4QQL2_9FLAO|nr:MULTISPECIES: sigma-70 family RNA polymerase sigma factor [Maribacter]HAI44537.1 RNA polymerase subunit sigma-24 [Maribacter sp.]MDP2527840.1 sigma-70 family RNA polymerase sigma factor [Maribacter dokdonensis]PHN93461.1 RNA polymerase subunit sigma-24 [Maribacter sp. 6B07]CAG2532025.1 ECF family [Maribacter dokdonensis]SDS68503.1 RNA polymerase sigma-70 factor, ECF subfamily [Maribacter dokdonensis]|tara:strand:+ start:645 stop:1226 length:582 start_codon:yes stop_codon:yes gene_type:complete
MVVQVEDSQLVKQYIQGDEKAIEALINRHNSRLTGFIYSKVGDRELTEDIFQDTFMKVIRTLKRGAYNEEGKFLPWVMRIAHNLVIDHFRKHNRMPMYNSKESYNIFSLLGDDKLNAEKQLIKEQIDTDLLRMIKELPEDQQEVLEMRIYKDMSFKEISDNTGVSINTALGRMRYALINLRKLVEANNIVLTN